MDTDPNNTTPPPPSPLPAGWTPHRFPNSNVVVILPKARAAMFNEAGVLHASYGSDLKVDLTATLHGSPAWRSPQGCPESALDFVTKLAHKKGAQPIDVPGAGTGPGITPAYRYFADPNTSTNTKTNREHTFYVIGIPGAVVVVSLTRHTGAPFLPALESIRAAIPHIIAEHP